MTKITRRQILDAIPYESSLELVTEIRRRSEDELGDLSDLLNLLIETAFAHAQMLETGDCGEPNELVATCRLPVGHNGRHRDSTDRYTFEWGGHK